MKKIIILSLALGLIIPWSSIVAKRNNHKGVARKKNRELGQELYVAAKWGHLNKVKKLLNNGADINYINKGSHETPLHEASDEGFLPVVKYLVNHGANMEIKNDKGRTPLYQAVDEGRTDVVKFLVSKGAKVDTKTNDGESILHLAVTKKNLDIVKTLVEDGNADLTITNAGKTPRQIAKGKIAEYLDSQKYLAPRKALKLPSRPRILEK